MKISGNVWANLRAWLSRSTAKSSKDDATVHSQAQDSLERLANDKRVPAAVRDELKDAYNAVSRLSEKLTKDQLHIAAFGRVSVGKSSLLNALAGQELFSVSPLHGETRSNQSHAWEALDGGGVILIDTPGIDELNGEAREQLARQATEEADLILFVCDADLTRLEWAELNRLAGRHRPIFIVLNKSDRYSKSESELLINNISRRTQSLSAVKGVYAASASPAPEIIIEQQDDGSEVRQSRSRPMQIGLLREALWQTIEKEGKTLAALNASLFALELDEKIAHRILEVKKDLATRIIRSYSMGKGVLVALNPLPVADVLAAAGSDVSMVVHLGEVYGFKISHREATGLLGKIAAQVTLLMGAYWGVNLLSSTLKGMTAGMSTVLTAASQGALAIYATTVIGRATDAYFLAGRSWGDGGAKNTLSTLLEEIDRESLLASAKADIRKLLGKA